MIRSKEALRLGDISLPPLPKEGEHYQVSYAAEQKNPAVYSIHHGPRVFARFRQTLIEMCNELYPDRDADITLNSFVIQLSKNDEQRRMTFSLPVPPEVSYETVKQLLNFLYRLHFREPSQQTEGQSFFAGYRNADRLKPPNLLTGLKNVSHRVASPQPELFVTPVETVNEHWKELHPTALFFTDTQVREPITGFLSNEAISLVRYPWTARMNFMERITHLLNRQDHPWRVELMVNPDRYSETELAHYVLMFYHILQQNPEYLFTHDHDDLVMRRAFYLLAQARLLEDQFTPVHENEIYGLTEQKREIETHLIAPLLTGEGQPLSMALLGPPGSGKTMITRLLMTEYAGRIAFIPLQISDFGEVRSDNTRKFETMIQKLQVLGNTYRLPYIFVVDDAERLFSYSVGKDMDNMASISAEDRSRMLRVLEGLGKTGATFIFTFNHPEVLDTAALRRMWPVAFALPDNEQRNGILRTVISHDVFADEAEREKVIIYLAAQTKGFNSSYLAKIQQVADNILAARRYMEEPIEVSQVYQEALAGVKRVANLKALEEAEKLAFSILQDHQDHPSLHLSL